MEGKRRGRKCVLIQRRRRQNTQRKKNYKRSFGVGADGMKESEESEERHKSTWRTDRGRKRGAWTEWLDIKNNVFSGTNNVTGLSHGPAEE